MRISTQQMYNTALSQMLQTQTDLAKTHEQITAQKKILRPSDDPVASAQILKLDRELAQTDKYNANLESAQRRLELAETTLGQFDTAVDRLKELAVQAATGTYSDADRATFAEEVEQIQSLVMSLMNTRDAQGEYLFAGSLGNTRPYVQNADGSFTYQGDDGQREAQVGAEFRVATTDSGRSIFSVIGDDMQVRPLGEATNRSSMVSNINVTGSDDLEGYVAEKGNLTAAIKVGQGGAYTYSVRDSSGAAVTGEVNDSGTPDTPLDNLTFDTAPSDSLALRDAGLEFDLNELPAVGGGLTDARLDVGVYQGTAPNEVNSTRVNNVTELSNAAGDDYAQFAAAEGDVYVNFADDGLGNPNSLTYTVTTEAGSTLVPAAVYQPGDTVTLDDGGGNDLYSFDINGAQADGNSVTLRAQAEVTLQPEQNHHTLLQTTEEFINALETPLSDQAAKDSYQQAIGKISGELTEAKDGNLAVMTQLGSRMNSLEIAREVNLDFKLYTETALSTIQDLDLTTAATEYKLQQVALQAAQSTFAQISKLSLFNYM